MARRSLITALACLGCVILATWVAVRSWQRSDSAERTPYPLDVPWVKSPVTANNLSLATPSIDELRGIVSDATRPPEERVQAIVHLANGNDWDSVEVLIAALSDESPLIRGRSAAGIRHVLGTDFYFRAYDDPTQRATAIEGIRRYWQSRNSNPPPRSEQR